MDCGGGGVSVFCCGAAVPVCRLSVSPSSLIPCNYSSEGVEGFGIGVGLCRCYLGFGGGGFIQLPLPECKERINAWTPGENAKHSSFS